MNLSTLSCAKRLKTMVILLPLTPVIRTHAHIERGSECARGERERTRERETRDGVREGEEGKEGERDACAMFQKHHT